jgi:hypothetical protein
MVHAVETSWFRRKKNTCSPAVSQADSSGGFVSKRVRGKYIYSLVNRYIVFGIVLYSEP